MAAESDVLVPAEAPSAPNTLDGTIGDLTQAVQDFAFPLLLIAVVSVFLGIQSRIDRRDPKLALAPVDSRHDVVEFR
ncbi:MAG TPA: hypothetical protein VG602_08780 [Actinomycetota bacterium]|nr:hypothetical protein [Actinomycetota bacterium]